MENIYKIILLFPFQPAHVNEKKNADMREFFNKYPGGFFEFFSAKFPEFLSDTYNHMTEFSSFSPLRKFYCDCHLPGRYSVHCCLESESFSTYDWENCEFKTF